MGYFVTEPLFTHAEPPPAKDAPPPPPKCGYPTNEKEIPTRCRKRGPHTVLIGPRKHGVYRHAVCETHLKPLLDGLAAAGMSYELL